jgi:hypothetical protein
MIRKEDAFGPNSDSCSRAGAQSHASFWLNSHATSCGNLVGFDRPRHCNPLPPGVDRGAQRLHPAHPPVPVAALGCVATGGPGTGRAYPLNRNNLTLSDHGLDGAVRSGAAKPAGVGGQKQVGSGKKNDPNKFASNPERASAAARKGGHESHKGD